MKELDAMEDMFHQWDEREWSRQVMVHEAICFLGECVKTKYLYNWFVVIHSNQSIALCCSICWTWVCLWLIEDGQNGATNGGSGWSNVCVTHGGLGHVLLIPWRERFMCLFAVAGLQFKYLLINSLLMFGHPFKKPCRVAFNRVEIVGLHKDWWANFTALALVLTECVKQAGAGWKGGWGARLSQGPGRGRRDSPGVVPILPIGIGSVHRSVEGSLLPLG